MRAGKGREQPLLIMGKQEDRRESYTYRVRSKDMGNVCVAFAFLKTGTRGFAGSILKPMKGTTVSDSAHLFR